MISEDALENTQVWDFLKFPLGVYWILCMRGTEHFMSEMNSENAANNARNISTWTNIFVPIYFYEEISFQKPFEDRELIIKVLQVNKLCRLFFRKDIF